MNKYDVQIIDSLQEENEEAYYLFLNLKNDYDDMMGAFYALEIELKKAILENDESTKEEILRSAVDFINDKIRGGEWNMA